jgi:hypothetical protein
MKHAVWLTFSFALLFGTSLLLADPAADEDSQNPWPGYVAGGRYFRSLDWGVAFWAPGNANQQLQQGDPAALVRYSIPTTRGKPGYVITVLGTRLKEDVPADQILAQATEGIRKVFGNKLTDLKTTPATDGKPSALAIGRIVCQTPAGKDTNQPILRQYVYLRLRAKQLLTLVAESTPAAGGEVGAILDSLAASVTAFDPKAEAAQTADGAERTANLLAAMQPADWEALVRGAKPQWFQLCAGPKGPEGPADPKPDAAAPANQQIGWLYSSTARKAAGAARQIESITSAQVSQADTTVSSYAIATIDLATGEETIRQWTRSARKDEAATETFLSAHRNGAEDARGTAAGSDKFDITTSTGGRNEKKFARRIPSLPYLPVALHDLLLARLVKEQGKTFGAFRFLDGEVIFETIQPVGLATSKTPEVRWLLRQGVTQPAILRYTDMTGLRTGREMTSPQAWTNAAAESDVPADLRASLTRPPQWP